ncbi:MAG: peptide-methionine (R)-S-oxide reductase MsrB [Gammaproteobacteria bacterium]|nr:peptide-methionine (R)-S-oxide reductase MsrB [Gammaproteobacteria bacterium]MCP5199446.1 peptide-methionine (R)-S-oxide reductase MsrB [Gammaproteobacteria bacterium]
MNRRHLLELLGMSAAAVVLPTAGHAAERAPDVTALHDGWTAFVPAGVVTVALEPRLERSDDEWRRALPQGAYDVLFEEDTERPFSSPLNEEKRRGLFVCRACELPLFTSAMKFDSGTGWPSFFTAIPGHLETKTDYKLIWPRTEYHCAKCGGHQGHVFDDGPAPTGQRWCNNGLALSFLPSTT